MARTGIEEKDVYRVANELVESGQEPTLQAIREKLGSGSFATISAHLKKWREQKIKESPIPELPDALIVSLKQIWATAFREATAQFDSARLAWETERKKLADENENLLTEIQKLETTVGEEQNHRKDAEAKAEGFTKIKQGLENELRDAREKLASLQGKLEANDERLKETLSRSERLERELAEIAKAQAQKPTR